MSKNILSNILIFAAGAAVGSIATWKLMQAECERNIQEEVESIRELYYEKNDKKENVDESNEDEEPDPRKDDKMKYKNIIKEDNYYYDEDDDEDDEKKEDEEEMIAPYIITPDEYDENGYDTVTLFLYEDGVLWNSDTDEVIEEDEIDDLVGSESLESFGKYGDRDEDSIYVRNDNLKIDFEILRDQRRYSEVD